MPLVPLRLLLDHAAENDYGLAALNVNNMEQIQAIMEAADETSSPVIIQASRGARKYSQDAYLRHLMLAAAELYPHIPVCMHQDHGNSPETCQSAIDNGFTSVMMDGSLMEDGCTPADFDYNVKVTKAVTDAAHKQGVSVEGELGCLGSLETGGGEQEDGHGATEALSHDQLLTDPDEAERFVAETGVATLLWASRRRDRKARCFFIGGAVIITQLISTSPPERMVGRPLSRATRWASSRFGPVMVPSRSTSVTNAAGHGNPESLWHSSNMPTGADSVQPETWTRPAASSTAGTNRSGNRFTKR